MSRYRQMHHLRIPVNRQLCKHDSYLHQSTGHWSASCSTNCRLNISETIDRLHASVDCLTDVDAVISADLTRRETYIPAGGEFRRIGLVEIGRIRIVGSDIRPSIPRGHALYSTVHRQPLSAREINIKACALMNLNLTQIIQPHERFKPWSMSVCVYAQHPKPPGGADLWPLGLIR